MPTKVCLVKAMVFPVVMYVWMWELDNKESWALKNWCFWIVVLEKTLESPLDSASRAESPKEAITAEQHPPNPSLTSPSPTCLFTAAFITYKPLSSCFYHWKIVFIPALSRVIIITVERSLLWLSGEGNGNPLQYSRLENPMDRGAWCVTIHGVVKNQTQLSNEHTHTLWL